LTTPSSTDRAAGRAPARATALWPFAVCAFASGIAAVAVLAGLMLWKLLPSATDALEAQSRESFGRTYAALFDGRIAELQLSLAAAANAPGVRAALADGGDAALRDAGSLLDSVLDFAIRVDVIPTGAARLDPDAAVPISYAALDLIKRAQGGAYVGPEAIDGERKLIYAAQPVEAQGSVIGVVFAAIDPTYFLTPLAKFPAGNGELFLEQSFDPSHTLTVLGWGDGDAAMEPRRLELALPYWSLRFRPGRTTVPQTLEPQPILIATAAAFALLSGGLAATFLLLGRHLRRNATNPHSGRPDLQGRVDEQIPGVEAAAALPTLEEFLEIDAGPEPAATPAANGESLLPEPGIPGAIFRAMDIHGVAGADLTTDAVYRIGRAFAAEALQSGARRLTVGRDGRLSSPELHEAIVAGLTESGIDVLDVGLVPTPLLQFATQTLEADGSVMITGSHHPPDHNGIELMLGGETLTGPRLQALRERILHERLSEGSGRLQAADVAEVYLDRVINDVVVAQPLRIVLDCGNGAAGTVAPGLFERLDCEVIPLYCDVDGHFPNHTPDPTDPMNLDDLATVVKAEGADLGIAFDGDGNRLGIVTASGRIIPADQLLMLLAQDVVSRNPGADVVYDVRCSRLLGSVISELGGRPIMWKSGHANIRTKVRETGALLGGDFSGHVCFGERWYGFDDALYAAARLLEIIGAGHQSADELVDALPQTCSTSEIRVPVPGEIRFEIAERLAQEADFADGTVTTIDGIRVDYADGWGLVRPSDTESVLGLRFEADTEEALARIQAIFAAQLQRIAPDLDFR
jgi:phosphomannomutase/phosphoglucomutase